MSNELLKDGFFGNKDIPACEKLGTVALLLGGTMEEFVSQDGKNQAFFSMVYNKGGNTPVTFTYGRPESCSEMVCKAQLHALGLEKYFGANLENVFNGSITDEEIVSKLADECKMKFNLSGDGLEKEFGQIEQKLQTYLKTCVKYDSTLADNPKIVEAFLETCKGCFSCKKKTIEK